MGVIPEIDPTLVAGGEKLILQKMGKGTKNFMTGAAMSKETAERTILSGFHQASILFENGVELLGTGDMGIGNTTASAAIGAVITETDVVKMVGRGTGVDDEGLCEKREVVRKTIHVNRPDREDGIGVLAKVGGFEIGGIAGCILAAAFHGHPVVVDGFISTAGALIAYTLCPDVVDYMIAGHCSEEAGHRIMLNYLGIEPVLDLKMRLGEGTGGALAMGIVEAAVKVFNEVATFEEAQVPR
jgi:nicotinate-nucleotide--dimethylbenzimidazole phosphoribosyltransferase